MHNQTNKKEPEGSVKMNEIVALGGFGQPAYTKNVRILK